MMDKVEYVLARLKEPSTWIALNTVAGILGLEISEEYGKVIAGFFGSVATCIAVFWKRDSQSKQEPLDPT